VPWARIGEFVGQRNLSVTADTYTHVLVDEAELDYGRLLTPTPGACPGVTGEEPPDRLGRTPTERRVR
jgi:hypothetical protein